MITSENSETFKAETNPPLSMIKERTIAMMKENEEFQSKNKPLLDVNFSRAAEIKYQ